VKVVNVVFMDFNKAFYTVPHSSILNKLLAVKNWLNTRAQGL